MAVINQWWVYVALLQTPLLVVYRNVVGH